jgi:hypothetical protein
MTRYLWSALNNQQVGTYFEYFVKMELTMYGYEVYTSEVDDRAIDFVARRGNGFIEVQVKCLRNYGYVFMPKSLFTPREGVYVALGLLFDGKEPDAYLIPSAVWMSPSSIFVDRDYDTPGLKSKPEWGINVSRKNMAALQEYAFSRALAHSTAA